MKTIEQLQEELESVKREIDKHKSDKYWFPKRGERFYFIDADRVDYWDQDPNHNLLNAHIRKREKNMFRTEEQAEEVLKAKKAIWELVGDFEPDWEDGKQEEWYVYYNHYYEELKSSKAYKYQDYGQIYFPTEDQAEQAITHFQTLMDNGAY